MKRAAILLLLIYAACGKDSPSSPTPQPPPVQQNPIFTTSGSGDNTFTMPSYVTRVRIDATYSGSCQNFIVRVSTQLTSLVNIIIGTCSVADTRSPFTGTYAIRNGGVVEIVSSTGINWTFTEQR